MLWANVTELILGVWLIVSPWVLGFSEIVPAFWSCTISGITLGLVALWELSEKESWPAHGKDTLDNNSSLT